MCIMLVFPPDCLCVLFTNIDWSHLLKLQKHFACTADLGILSAMSFFFLSGNSAAVFTTEVVYNHSTLAYLFSHKSVYMGRSYSGKI